ncbi:putative DNA repair protein [Aspergillus lucknowensis]|uniref:Protein artemis n=1 Tax=Aspergillus lucknowensis TaxID=176173 RepID=A0ABR4LWA9_9EURO
MSTFDGIVQEFPFISIDHFRKNPERPPPLACFLSHAHSDHLQGLESFRAPFIYCSAATKELVLRLEKYPHRMNFNNGILESRRLHYKHLSKLLRPIPLNTPTEIDLTPRLSIRVTLFGANHCTGAVMFLIEGDGKAILYTGDIRAESWWVDGLIRHPVLIPYTLGTKRIDKLYLDTTFAHTSHAFRTFPTKAEGIAELLGKLEPYPEDTIFYFRAWTFGYEEVWMALSAALRSKVHVDRYQLGLYRYVSSSGEGSGAIEATSLCGYELGNRIVSGCLSEDERSRIHSCEPGVHCSAVYSERTVYITPIVSRTRDGSDVPEVGAGGGWGDLYQVHELELPDQLSLARLEQLCSDKIHDSQALSRAREALSEAFKSRSKSLSLDAYGMKDAHEMPLNDLVDILSRGRQSDESILSEHSTEYRDRSGRPLPKTIRFPYSRHSSYAELCKFVAAFRPRDIHPCIVDPSDWDEDISMQSLFGHLCSGSTFVHDQFMREIVATENGERPRKRARYNPEASTQSTQQSNATTGKDTDSQTSRNLGIVTTEADGEPAAASPRLPAALGPRSSRPPINTARPFSSSGRTTVPSIQEPVKETPDVLNNDSLPFPQLCPGTAKARRNAIRQAWHLLHDAQISEHTNFQLGSLPSSWPTDEDRSQMSVLGPETSVPNGLFRPHISQEMAIRDPTTTDLQLVGSRIETSRISTSDSVTDANRNTNPNMTVIMETDIESEHDSSSTPEQQINQNPDFSSQQSHTTIISSSLFASQSQNQDRVQEQDEGVTDDEEYIRELEHKREHAPAEEQEANSQHVDQNPNPNSNSNLRSQSLYPRLLRRKSSVRDRRAAYLAAREDSYDAWASVSIVSAGNNHTEEEVEL